MAKFSLSDIKSLTPDQKELRDEKATGIAKENCVSILSKCDDSKFIQTKVKGSKTITNRTFPKPETYDNIRNVIAIKDQKICHALRDDAAAALLVFMFSSMEYEQVMQKISTVSYHMACNDIKIHFMNNLHEIQDLACRYHSSYNTSLLGKILHICEHTIVLEDVSIVDTSNVAQTLIAHLESYSSMKEVIDEICRLQMLSSRSLRSEDAYSALINAWTHSK